MPNDIFTFDELPDSSKSTLEEGLHTLTIMNVEQKISQTSGSLMVQFSYTIDNNSNLKLNYDNCPLTDKDGNLINFGANKLKKIIRATGTTIERFTIASLKPLLVGKSFEVVLSKNDKGYLVIDAKNIDTIKPVSSTHLTSSPETQLKEEKINLNTETVTIEDDEDNW